jgi:hypothetical protein
MNTNNDILKPIFSIGVKTNNLIANSGSVNNLNSTKSNINTLNVDILTINDKINGNVDINGNTSVDNVNIQNNLNVSGNTQLNNLDVSGNTNFYILPTCSGNVIPKYNNQLVSKEYVDNTRIFNFQKSVQTASTEYIDISNPPSTIGGFNLSPTNRILLAGQNISGNPDIPSINNGIYIYNGLDTSLTIADDAFEVNLYNYAYYVDGYGSEFNGIFFTQYLKNAITGQTPVAFIGIDGLYPPVGQGLEYVNSYLQVKSNLDFLTHVNISGNLNVSQTSTLNDVIISGNLTVDNDLTVNGNTYLNYLDVSGNITINNDLTVNGNTYLNSIDVSGNLTIYKDLTVNGNTILGNANTDLITFNGKANSNLDMNNNILLNVLSANINTLTNPTTIVSNNLTVNGNTTTVSGNLEINSSTQSTTYGNGALVVLGGVGIAKDVNINGNLNVNETVSSTFVGNLTGSATNATNATNTNITISSANTSYYPSFVSGTSGNLAQLVNTGLTYNPSTNTLTTSTFVGNLSGTATNATNATYTTYTNITTSSANASYYPSFVSGTSGNLAQLVNTGLTYNPSTNTLTTGNLTVNGNTTLGDTNSNLISFNGKANTDLNMNNKNINQAGTLSLYGNQSTSGGQLQVNGYGSYGGYIDLTTGGTNSNIDYDVRMVCSYGDANLVGQGTLNIYGNVIANNNLIVSGDTTLGNSGNNLIIFNGKASSNLDLNTNNLLNVNTANIGTLINATTNISGITNITNTTQSTSTGSGAFVVSGGVGIGADTFIGGNLSVNGSLLGTGNVLSIASNNYLCVQSTSYLFNETISPAGSYIGWNSNPDGGVSGRMDLICNRASTTGTNGGFNFFIQDSSGSGNVSSPIAYIDGNGLLSIPSITVSGTTTSTYFTTSDYRIKSNIEPLNDTYITDNLNPIKYTNTQNSRTEIGFLAHELEQEYPYLVSGEKDGETLQSVNYIGLIGILVNEIKSLKTRVEILEKSQK